MTAPEPNIPSPKLKPDELAERTGPLGWHHFGMWIGAVIGVGALAAVGGALVGLAGAITGGVIGIPIGALGGWFGAKALRPMPGEVDSQEREPLREARPRRKS